MVASDSSLSIHFFSGDSPELYISEFGHSLRTENYRVGPWVRDIYLLHVIVHGTCRFCGTELAAGNAFLIAQGVLHDFTVSPGYEHYWIGFGGSRAEALLRNFELPTAQHTVFQLCDLEFLHGTLSAAFVHEQEAFAQSALFSVLPLLNRKTPPLSGKYAERAAEFLEKNYSHPITMEETANAVRVSEKHLCRLFRQAYGMPPQKYLLQVRMKHAEKLLANTELRVKEIAASVGYSSPLTFSEMFARHSGSSPTQWRQTVREKTENDKGGESLEKSESEKKR